MLAFLLALWLTGLKARTEVPKHFDTMTVSQVLKASPSLFVVGDAITVSGKVAGVRHEADGDYHIELADKATANRAHSIVCEITPEMPLRVPKLGESVTISGWVFWDGHHLHEPGRGTQWEVHPVTSILVAK